MSFALRLLWLFVGLLAECNIAAATAGEVPSKVTVDAWGHLPLPIVQSGTNAPEALLRIYRAFPVEGGVERVFAIGGPCRSRAGAHFSFMVRTNAPLNAGALYYTVPQGTFGPHGFIPKGAGWALRQATSVEMRSYIACHWSR